MAELPLEIIVDRDKLLLQAVDQLGDRFVGSVSYFVPGKRPQIVVGGLCCVISVFELRAHGA